MTYVHDGSEVYDDHFELTVTDGIQNSTAIMTVKMHPVDDQDAFFLGVLTADVNMFSLFHD